MGTIGTEEWHASPYVAAEVMLSLAESNGSELTVLDLAYGVSQLPHERLFPQLAPTAQQMVKVDDIKTTSLVDYDSTAILDVHHSMKHHTTLRSAGKC